MKLEDPSDYLITGMRMRLDFSQCKNQSSPITLRLFNRTQKFTQYGQSAKNPGLPLVFDVPFCDAEVLFGTSQYNTHLSFELQTDDPKQCPIRLVSLEVFCLSRKDFGYKEKLRKLEKLNAERLKTQMKSLTPAKTSQALSEEAIKAELLKTKSGMPLVSWKEKATFLSTQISQQHAD